MKKILYSLITFGLLIFTSCESDFPNPNAPTVNQVINSANGLQGLVVAIQSRYSLTGAGGLYATITANGMTTNELNVINAGNADIFALSIGGTTLIPSNPVVTNLWSNLNLVRYNSELLIDNSSKISEPGTAGAVRIYGHLFKAIALGSMAQFWTHGVLQTANAASFGTREQCLTEAIRLLDEASNLLTTLNIPASFTTAVGNNIDLANSLRALSARYNLMLGNYAQALARANAVNLSSKSQFIFDNVAQNPVFRTALTNNNTYAPKANFGLPAALAPAPTDGRIAFYLTANAANGRGHFLADNTPIPLYMPSEMTLIKAECFARQSDLANAVIELNKILTKTAATDPFGVGANLPAYAGPNTLDAILTEIYKNRCIELFMSGLKLDDNRRFNRSGPGPLTGTAERNRNFYPFPNTERDNNANTPADPAN